MMAETSGQFRWDELLIRIKRKNVIPVIGHGLYRIEDETEPENDVPFDRTDQDHHSKGGPGKRH